MTLPEGWRAETLREACVLLTDGTHNSPSNSTSGDFPYITAKNVKWEGLDFRELTYVSRQEHEEIYRRCPVKVGDVLLIKDGATTGVAAINSLTEPFSLLSSVAVLRPVADLLNNRFLWYWLKSDSAQDAMIRSMSGSAIRRLTLTTIGRTVFPIAPLAEQRRIVAKLDALTAGIARARVELDRVPALAKNLRTNILIECFRGLETTAVELGTRLVAIEAGKNLRCVERPPRQGEHGVVKVSAVTWGRFDISQAKTLPSDYTPLEKARIRQGDLLISRANTLELVGAAVLVEDEPQNLFLSDKILRLVAEEDDKRWMLWFLRSPIGRRQIENAATGNQLSMRNISQEAIRRLRMPFPDVTTRQNRIRRLEAVFSRADRLEAEAARAHALLHRLEAALLAKAFRGELVPQDPNDEPASVLFDRIRAERAATSKPRRSREKVASSPNPSRSHSTVPGGLDITS